MQSPLLLLFTCQVLSGSGLVAPSLTEEDFITSPPVNIMASIEPASDHELVSETYYTTYTYFTTSFANSTSSVSSREETESNVITFTKVGDQLSRLPEILTTLYTTYTHLTTID